MTLLYRILLALLLFAGVAGISLLIAALMWTLRQ